MEQYTREAADLHAGRKPNLFKAEGTTIRDIANNYLAAQLEKAKRGLIRPASFNDCLQTVRAFVRTVGAERQWTDIGPDDCGQYRLKLYDSVGVCAIERSISIVRSMFRHAYDTKLIDQPVRYGGQFNKPSQKEKRRNRSERDRKHGKRLFAPEEIRLLLNNAQQPLKAMILLGINGGFGNTDCAELPVQAVDLQRQLIDYERPKTAVQRVMPLWPETADALREVMSGKRPRPSRPEFDNLVFLTRFGNPWKQEQVRIDGPGGDPKVSRHSAIVLEFGKLLDHLGMKRPGLGFYALRHTFRTWSDETHDQHAIHRMMGHAIPGMSGLYVEEVSVARLRCVAEHVRQKAFSLQ